VSTASSIPETQLFVQTPDPDVNAGVALALRALQYGARPKAGIVVPTVCGAGDQYPEWIHPYDNYWVNKVSSYVFTRESTEWPIRLFAAYQSPLGEIGGGVYAMPFPDWRRAWEDAGGLRGWQQWVARPLADHAALQAAEPERIQYGIYVRDHLFVLQVHDQWLARGSLPFLIEMYNPCRRALKYLEQRRDVDHDGLIETATILSDVVVNGDEDIHSTIRAEDQVMLYGALVAFADMARVLGGEADAAWALDWARRVKTALNERMWSPEGRYIFGIDRRTGKPRLEYVTTTYADGYAILFGIADAERSRSILDFMARQEFQVPGPYHIPPVRVEDNPRDAPGVYCNGGCGWGRGIVPSVALACFLNGRTEQGADYVIRQARAARAAGSFHEYWTWELYAGRTEPGGAPWYAETSAGFLDALVHGLFGLSPAGPGFAGVRLAPRMPAAWSGARLDLRLPRGEDLSLAFERSEGRARYAVGLSGDAGVEIQVPWPEPGRPMIEGERIQSPRVTGEPGRWVASALIAGSGSLTLSGAGR
jgi:hypothetical protein